MGRIVVRLASPPMRSYEVHVGAGLLAELGSVVREACPATTRVLLVADAAVHGHHGARAEESLAQAELAVTSLQVAPGEGEKRRATVAAVQDAAIEAGADRASVVIALGGGVAGDVAGFVAATLFRGIPWIGVPTSLLAMVDSAIGGKTGVDTDAGKNLIGAFWQPAAVVADIDTLATLSDAELRAGFAEVIKYGVIVDAQLFVDLEDGLLESCLARVPAALCNVVERCVAIKAAVVAEDEREGNRRQILNFGHTIGHALETVSDYRLGHGQAVAIGMVAEARLAEKVCDAAAGLAARIAELCSRAGLPTSAGAIDADAAMAAMRHDKKVRDGRNRCALPVDLGEMACDDGVWSIAVQDEALRAALSDE